MPENHVQMPGETCVLPREMPAAAATIQEGICFLNMCAVLCLIHQRSHYIVSVAPAGSRVVSLVGGAGVDLETSFCVLTYDAQMMIVLFCLVVGSLMYQTQATGQ
jgi:hypothetical protein